MRFLILDGYVDEPTALGVPPYISPYVRYVAGAIITATGHEIVYRTIDQLRQESSWPDADVVVVISGNPVPGKYLGGKPITHEEIKHLFHYYRKKQILWGGPKSIEKMVDAPHVFLIERDIEAAVADVARGGVPRDRYRSLEEWEQFAVFGTEIVLQHPSFPFVMIELETGRGCPRKVHCSFCLEGLFDVEFRSIASLKEEVRRLFNLGCRYFRLGKQADILSYQADFSYERDGFFRPVPERLESLYSALREAAPDLKTLHLDNMNPGTIARFPDESAQILETIVRYNTAGDVAAFGMESADPEVVKANHLKASPEQVFEAIRLVNQIGGVRVQGIPKLLPGINLIHGLPGERRETFRLNYEFLCRFLEENLLLRRINIRQLKITPETPLAKLRMHRDVKIEAAFRLYREKIRDEVDSVMLERVFPIGVVLCDLMVEGHRGEWSLARQLATYPITVNLPRVYPLGTRLEALVINHRERSLIGLSYPVEREKLSFHELRQIPGMEKRAGALIASGKITLEDFRETPLYESLVRQEAEKP